MPKKSKKSKSKRVPLRRKHRIIKKINEHAKKKKKELRKDKLAGKVQPRTKDPGIPSSYPFKAELMRELEFNRERDRLKKERKKAENKLRREENMRDLQQTAETRSRAFEEDSRRAESSGGLSNGDVDNTKGFYKAFNKVVEYADVLIQVLDARDPLGTRCQHVERHLKKNARHKHMLLLLNKCDLVPAWVTKR